MPELPPSMRNFILRMKFLTLPSRQTQKVLPLAGFSFVVSPWITPSLTDHNRGSPSQPARSLPLKRLTYPRPAQYAGLLQTPTTIKPATISIQTKFDLFILQSP